MKTRPISVLINRNGGTAQADPKIAAKVRTAFRQAGVDVKVALIDGGKCAAQCDRMAKRGDPLVVIGGGDGTLSAAAGALSGSKTALGILPLGTLNHFARDLGIGFDLDSAVKVIAAGKRKTVDLAEVNGRAFINNSAIGLYPLMVADREGQQERLGRGKKFALFVASLRTLIRFKHQRLTLTTNGGKEHVDSPLMFVGNNEYETGIGAAGQRRSLSEGKLFVVVMAAKSRFDFFAAGMRALLGQRRPDDLIELNDIRRLKVESRRHALHVSVDGEVEVMIPPLEYRIRPRALIVLAP